MMNNFQKEKKLILDYYRELDSAEHGEVSTVLENYISKEYVWRGFHPFNELSSALEVSKIFWEPFRHAFKNMQRRMDIFIAGNNEIDGFKSVWVVSISSICWSS